MNKRAMLWSLGGGQNQNETRIFLVHSTNAKSLSAKVSNI